MPRCVSNKEIELALANFRDGTEEWLDDSFFGAVLKELKQCRKKLAELNQTPRCTFDEEMDATDGACPRWWAGEADGSRFIIKAVTEILDGKPPVGKRHPEFQALVDRVWKLYMSVSAGGI